MKNIWSVEIILLKKDLIFKLKRKVQFCSYMYLVLYLSWSGLLKIGNDLSSLSHAYGSMQTIVFVTLLI